MVNQKVDINLLFKRENIFEKHYSRILNKNLPIEDKLLFIRKLQNRLNKVDIYQKEDSWPVKIKKYLRNLKTR
jgi:hypothetical protein